MTDQPTESEPIDYVARTAALEQELAEARSTADTRVLRSELKNEALRAGIIDLDGLKLFDIGAMRLSADGTSANAAELILQMRRDKPWLFTKHNTSQAAPSPQPLPAKTRMAKEMDYREWQTARERLIRGR